MAKETLLLGLRNLKALKRLECRKVGNYYSIKGTLYKEVKLPACFGEWFVCLAAQDVLSLDFDELWKTLLNSKNEDIVIAYSSIIANKYCNELKTALAAYNEKLPTTVRTCLMEIAKSEFECYYSDEYLSNVNEHWFEAQGLWEAVFIKARAL